MEKITKEVTIFKVGDKEFLTEKEAVDYEKNVISRLEDISYFIVRHSPDLTEGRGLYRSTYVAVESKYSAQEYLKLFCERIFGSQVAWVMGTTITKNYEILTCTKEKYESYKSANTGIGSRNYKVNQIFLSSPFGGGVDGFPEPINLPGPKDDIEEYIKNAKPIVFGETRKPFIWESK